MVEGNGSKVVVGCCSAVAVVAVAAVLGLFVLTNKGCEMWKGALESAQQNAASLETWKAALEGSGDDSMQVSPSEFSDFQRSAQSADANPPGFDLGKTGQLDEFSSSGATLSVWITPASALEVEAISERVKEQVDSRFSIKSHASFSSNGTGYRNYRGSSPVEKGMLVHSDGWLLLLQTNDDSLDLHDLLRRYCEAAGSAVPAQAPTAEPKPGDDSEGAEAEAPLNAPNPPAP